MMRDFKGKRVGVLRLAVERGRNGYASRNVIEDYLVLAVLDGNTGGGIIDAWPEQSRVTVNAAEDSRSQDLHAR